MDLLLMIHPGRPEDLDPSQISSESGFASLFRWPGVDAHGEPEVGASIAHGVLALGFVRAPGPPRLYSFDMVGQPPASDPLYDEFAHWIPSAMLDRIREYAAEPRPNDDIHIDVDPDELVADFGDLWKTMIDAINRNAFPLTQMGREARVRSLQFGPTQDQIDTIRQSLQDVREGRL